MPSRAEVWGEGTRRGEATVGMPWRAAPLPASLALGSRLGGRRGAIVQLALLPIGDPGQHRALGGTIACAFLGAEPPRAILPPCEALTEARRCGLLIALARDEERQDIAVLLYGPPQRVAFAIACKNAGVSVPRVPRPGPRAPPLMGRRVRTCATPLAGRCVRHAQATDEEALFDIPGAQIQAEGRHPAGLMISAGKR